jgi:hypothetical protein
MRQQYTVSFETNRDVPLLILGGGATVEAVIQDELENVLGVPVDVVRGESS